MSQQKPEDPAAVHDRNEWLSKLQTSRRKELKQIHRALPVPAVHELDGEFQGLLLDQGNVFATKLTAFFINKGGTWLGKAFQPLSEEMGQGYNVFRTRRGINRCLRMQVHLRDTDEGPRLMIEYHERNEGLIGRISDDVRRAAPGLFLGIGFVPLGGRLFPSLQGRVMFAMVGPTAPFQTAAADRDLFTEDDTFTGIAA